jgi:hypothetical protein
MRALQMVVCVILLSCSSPSPPATVTPRIDERVRVLADDLVAVALVDASKVTFPLSRANDVKSLSAGDIIVSNYQEGFLRRVVSVAETASGWVIETAVAVLTDAIIDADIDETFTIPIANEDFSGSELLSVPQGRVTAKVGVINVQQTLRLTAKIRNRQYENVEVNTVGSVDARTVIEGLLTAQASHSIRKPLWERRIATKVVWIKIIPIRITVDAALEAIGSVEAKGYVKWVAGASMHAEKKIGVRYADETMTPFHEPLDYTHEFSGPEVDIGAQVTLIAGVSVPITTRIWWGPGVLVRTNAPLKLVGNFSGTPPAASWCTSFDPSLEAGVLFYSRDNSISATLWEASYPFEAGLGVDGCSLWDLGKWDKAFWR